jgi:hypothetical protein
MTGEDDDARVPRWFVEHMRSMRQLRGFVNSPLEKQLKRHREALWNSPQGKQMKLWGEWVREAEFELDREETESQRRKTVENASAAPTADLPTALRDETSSVENASAPATEDLPTALAGELSTIENAIALPTADFPTALLAEASSVESSAKTKLKRASEQRIRNALDVVYSPFADGEGPNLNDVVTLVKDDLKQTDHRASKKQIQNIARDTRFACKRREVGKRRS